MQILLTHSFKEWSNHKAANYQALEISITVNLVITCALLHV